MSFELFNDTLCSNSDTSSKEMKEIAKSIELNIELNLKNNVSSKENKKLEVLFIVEEFKYRHSFFFLERYNRDIANFYCIEYTSKINEIINLDMFDCICYSCISPSFIKLPNLKKITSRPIFLGGNLHYLKESYIKSRCDWYSFYKGEKPLREALLNLKNKKPLISSIENRPLTIAEYNNMPNINTTNLPSKLFTFFSHGCPFSCKFCENIKPTHSGIELLKRDLLTFKENGVSELCLSDDCIFWDKKFYMEAFEYCKKIDLIVNVPYISLYFTIDELNYIINLNPLSLPSIHLDAVNEETFIFLNKKGKFLDIFKFVNLYKYYNIHTTIVMIVGISSEEQTKKDILFWKDFKNSFDVTLKVNPLSFVKGSELYKDRYKYIDIIKRNYNLFLQSDLFASSNNIHLKII